VLAGATERIRLQTEVLLGPLRTTALLAKQVATLDRMSGGRFTLGIGVGGRDDDHEAAGTPMNRAQYGDGFLCAAPLQWAATLVATVREQWDRSGSPRMVFQVNVAVGSAATIDAASAAVAGCYAFTGRDGWGAPVSDPHRIADLVAEYRQFGADERCSTATERTPTRSRSSLEIAR